MSHYDVNLKVVTIETSNDLIELFDEDDNGNNGTEYLIDDARNKGFKTNASYYISQTNDICKLIAFAYRSSYYMNYDYQITEYDGKKIVSIAWSNQ